jgi:tetratricopeptide (TPR) repeat protein
LKRSRKKFFERKRANLPAAALLLLCTTLLMSHAQTENEPAWLLYERGLREMSRGEPGAAINFLFRALEKKNLYPEAEMALGDIYRSEAEPELAEKQYERALALRDFLETPEDHYTVRYRLVDLHETQGSWENYRETLVAIIQADEVYVREIYEKSGEAFQKTYLDSGVDRLLQLYRLPDRPEARAHSELGWYYYRTGRFEPSAIRELLFAAVIQISSVVTELIRLNPDYRFTTLSELWSMAEKRRHIREHIAGSTLFESLYHLAAASYAMNHSDRAREVWAIVAETEMAAQYRSLSERQLADPWIEPLLDLP